MAQQEKALATKPDILSSITQKVGESISTSGSLTISLSLSLSLLCDLVPSFTVQE